MEDLERDLTLSCAQAHAAMARVAVAAAEFDEIGGWADGGIKSFAHWLAIWGGFDAHTGAELLRVGNAMRSLPLLSAAFARGELSFDKMRQLTTVATPDTDELMISIARGASGSQLARICRSLRRMTQVEGSRHSRRGLWSRIEEDGMLRLVALLPPEEGELAMRAIESVTAQRELPDDAIEPVSARRADGLVAMAEHVLAGGAPDLVAAGEARQMVVHVDVGVLTGELPDGACNLENGIRLSASAARRIGCEAEIIPVIERDGLPIDVGRKHRAAPQRLRRALEVRDRFCRYPGCGVPARRAQAHHHDPWYLGGETNLADMLMLCWFHHARFHDGAYRIVKAGGDFRFETNDGRVIGAPQPAEDLALAAVAEGAAWAEWGGAHLDFDHTMWVLGSRAGPAN